MKQLKALRLIAVLLLSEEEIFRIGSWGRILQESLTSALAAQMALARRLPAL